MADEEKGADSAPEPKKSKKKEEATEPKFTDSDLEQAVSKALEKERAKAASDAEKTRKEQEDAAARKQGEFQKLYESETARVKALEASQAELRVSIKRKDVEIGLRDHLVANHKDYLANAKYILPLLKFDADTTDDDLQKQIKSVVSEYVKDNPRTVTGGAPGRGPSPEPSGSAENKKKETIPTPHYLGRF